MMPIPNGLIRMQARKSLKNNMHIALLIALTVSLASLLMQVCEIIGGNSINSFANDIMNRALMTDESINPEDVSGQFLNVLTHQSVPTYIFFFLNIFLTPALTMGENFYLLKIARGESGTYTDVFAKLKYCLKAIGLQIVTGIKSTLWGLPGIAFSVLGLVLLIESNGGIFWMLVSYAGMIAACVMSVRALLSYSLSPVIMAEDTTKKARQCIAESKSLMTGRRWQMFALQFTFVIMNLALEMISTMLSLLIGQIIGMTVSMALSLAVNVYLSASICNFYLIYSGKENAFAVTQIHQNQDGTISSDDSTVE